MNHKPLKHIIWDWNGTLLNDIGLCVELINRILTKRGLKNVDTDSYRADFGFPVVDYYHALGLNLENESFESISGEFIASYQARWRDCRLHDSVPETLEELGRLGYSHSVLSASGQAILEEAVAHYDLEDHFLGLIGQGDDFAHGKLESGRSWVDDLDWDPEEILLIGDTLHDFEVARNLGLNCALVECGHHPRNRLQTAGVPILPNLREVTAFVTSHFPKEPSSSSVDH